MAELKNEELNSVSGGAVNPYENGKYIVKQGDCLWSIAQKYHISLQALIAMNPQIKNPDVIQIGQEINVPVIIYR